MTSADTYFSGFREEKTFPATFPLQEAKTLLGRSNNSSDLQQHNFTNLKTVSKLQLCVNKDNNLLIFMKIYFVFSWFLSCSLRFFLPSHSEEHQKSSTSFHVFIYSSSFLLFIRSPPKDKTERGPETAGPLTPPTLPESAERVSRSSTEAEPGSERRDLESPVPHPTNPQLAEVPTHHHRAGWTSHKILDSDWLGALSCILIGWGCPGLWLADAFYQMC